MSAYLWPGLFLACFVVLAALVARGRPAPRATSPAPPHARPRATTAATTAGEDPVPEPLPRADASMSHAQVLDLAAETAERYGPGHPRTIEARRAATERISRFVMGRSRTEDRP